MTDILGQEIDSVCPLCGAERAVAVWDRFRSGIADLAVSCTQCGFVYRQRPDGGYPETGNYYAHEYREAYFSPGKQSIAGMEKIFGAYQVKRIDRLEGYWRNGIRLLEIGCGPGYFLKAARERGAVVTGVELDRAQANYARENYGLNVVDKSIADAGLPQGSFDMICLFQVLEHIDAPVEFLSDLRRWLAPGGYLVVEVPNLQNPLVSLYDIPEFKTFWFQQPHLSYFSDQTLGETLTRSGLIFVSCHAYQEIGLANHITWMTAGIPTRSRDRARRLGMPLGEEKILSSPLVVDLDALIGKADYEYRMRLEEAGYGDILLAIAALE